MALEARIVTLTDNEDQLIAPRTDADAVSYDENNTVKAVLDRFAVETYTKEEVDAAIRKAAPINLLDNSDFTNPVNQRGETSGTITYYEYTVDRWQCRGGDWSVGNDGITITPGSSSTVFEFIQRTLENNWRKYVGEILTFAVCLSDGTIFTTSGRVPVGTGSYQGISIREYDNLILLLEINRDNNLTSTVMAKSSITIRWAVLYEGEYTADTLPEYQPKGYVAELAECQRYFLRYNLEEGMIVSTGNTYGAYIRIPFYTPHALRIKPSTAYSASFSIVYEQTELDLTGLDVYRCSGNFVDMIPSVNGESPVGYVPVSLRVKTSGYIDFIADL